MANRGRRAERKPTWELLWLPATVWVFAVAAVFQPLMRSPWQKALYWAALGTAWLSFVVLVSRIGRRRRGPAGAGSVRERSLGWRWGMWLTIYLVAAQLHPLAPGLPRFAVFAIAGVLIVIVEFGLQALWHRTEAARRRREVSDLAREF